HNPMFVNPDTGFPEQCDDGESSPFCDGDCTLPRCGDAFFNPHFLIEPEDGGAPYLEECDHGPLNHERADCLPSCREARCGDGFVHDQGSGTEQCDEDVDADGIADNTATCDRDCSLPACGDGLFNP